MRYFSVCSGIEAATVAWRSMGWEPVAFSEIEPFPAAVLKHHYPNVPNLGDMTKINGGDYRGVVDVLVGGTPCQAFSVAGLRRGLVDPRGSLTLTFAKLADDMAVPFIVWENVPGVLSDATNAFGCLIGYLAGDDDPATPGARPQEGRSGQFWKWDKKRGRHVPKWPPAGWVVGPHRIVTWRVLDAQWFGLAQRRRRVFVVACPRDGADPREILFEREGLRRDSAPSREAGEGFAHDVAPCIGASGRGFERGGDTRGQDPMAVMTLAIRGRGEESNLEIRQDGTANALLTPNGGRGGIGVGAVAFAQNTRDEVCLQGGDGQIVGALAAEPGMKQTTYVASPAVAIRDEVTPKHQEELAFTLTQPSPSGGGHPQSVHHAMQVRRLTCEECEALQGFPRGYTLIPWRNKPADQCPDGPRYKALGNSMAVPCMRWIGRRIELYGKS